MIVLFSEFNIDIGVRVLYTKKDKFLTKIVLVQEKFLPQPKKIYTGMPVMPVTNSWSAFKSSGLMSRQETQ